MAKLNIKKGDTVVVISGKEKGKTGKVLETSKELNKTVVADVNIVTKHQKARNAREKGGIVKKPAPINTSNLMIICPVCGKATRVARKQIEGKNVRVCKKCGASLDKAFVKAVKKEAKAKDVEKVEETKTETKTTKATTAKPTNEKAVSQNKTSNTSSARRVGNRGK